MEAAGIGRREADVAPSAPAAERKPRVRPPSRFGHPRPLVRSARGLRGTTFVLRAE